MTLADLWFIIIAVVWTVFFVLEGFDFGVGALHQILARDEYERRVLINTIGPWWDGNEVWLIVGGAGIFAAFPAWYATWFSAGYLALLLILVGLIVRGLSFEYRGQRDSAAWRSAWSWGLSIGSALVPLLIGVALGDLIAGLPIASDGNFTGNFFDLLTPFGLITGVTLLALCLLLGSTFITIRTTGDLAARARALVTWMGIASAVLVVVSGIAMIVVTPAGVGRAIALPIVALIAVVGSLLFMQRGRNGSSFLSSAIAMGASVATLFVNLFPNVMVSSTSAANNLTVSNSSSAHYALTVMTIVVAVFLPIVLLYQGWSFYVFRHRVSGEPIAPALARSLSPDLPASTSATPES
jgi:cytochrome bd ubiquinol oxidase subunit II